MPTSRGALSHTRAQRRVCTCVPQLSRVFLHMNTAVISAPACLEAAWAGDLQAGGAVAWHSRHTAPSLTLRTGTAGRGNCLHSQCHAPGLHRQCRLCPSLTKASRMARTARPFCLGHHGTEHPHTEVCLPTAAGPVTVSSVTLNNYQTAKNGFNCSMFSGHVHPDTTAPPSLFSLTALHGHEPLGPQRPAQCHRGPPPPTPAFLVPGLRGLFQHPPEYPNSS